MTEVFRRESAEHPEPFTGERLTSAIDGQVQIEHYHRYLLARAMVPGLDVLDVASGEGYGSALLAQVARSVVGLDCAGGTVRAAAANFPRENLRFLQADACALPLHDACVDVIVSFETIEHLKQQRDFLREVYRVLRPDGWFMVSTPEREVYSAPGATPNPFHVHELDRGEFQALLLEQFRNVEFAGQRPMIGSALFADTPSAPPLVFDRHGNMQFEAGSILPRAPYIIAVASNRETPPLPSSLYIDRSDLDTDAAHVTELTATLAGTTQRACQVEAALAATERHNETVRRQYEQVQLQYQAMQRQQAATQRQLDEVQSSFRTFVRGYLPRLYRHLRGQRP